jgi:sugar (pentulose or hexulose) kinase
MNMILALDCGSTNLKAAIFDGDLRRLSDAQLPAPLAHQPFPGAFELDPETFWESILALIRQACELAAISPSQVTDLAITSQAQTFVLLDELFQPITPLISWLDRRAELDLERLQESLGPDFAIHCSFPHLQVELQVAKLAWLYRCMPELLKRTRLIASLPTWLGLRLGFPAILDDNLAAMSGLYSLHSDKYWPAALEFCGLHLAQLPELVKCGTFVPLVNGCAELGFGPRTVLTLAGNDQTCGALGNNCRADAWVVSLGTALVAYRLAGENRGPYHHVGCWGSYPMGGYYELAVESYGGAALDWASEKLFPGKGWMVFFDAAKRAAAAKQISSNFFFPKRMSRPDAWQGPFTTRSEKALAALEGVCFTLNSLIFEDLGAGADLLTLLATGGGSRNPFWLSLVANILGIRVQRGHGDTLLGAARLARPGIEPFQREDPPQTWLPDPITTSRYIEKYKQWRDDNKETNEHRPGL